MLPKYIPMNFSSLTIGQLECIEDRSILTNDNDMRFTLMKAAKGDQMARRKVMDTIAQDPSWIDSK